LDGSVAAHLRKRGRDYQKRRQQAEAYSHGYPPFFFDPCKPRARRAPQGIPRRQNALGLIMMIRRSEPKVFYAGSTRLSLVFLYTRNRTERILTPMPSA
jgi:hypothetical protein